MSRNDIAEFLELEPALAMLKKVRGPLFITIYTPDDPIFVRVPKRSVQDWWSDGWCEHYILTLQPWNLDGWLADIDRRH